MMTSGMKENLRIVRHNIFVSFSSREKELMVFNAYLLCCSLGISIFALSSLHLTPGCMIVDLTSANQSCVVRDHILFSFDSRRSRITCVDDLIDLMNIRGITVRPNENMGVGQTSLLVLYSPDKSPHMSQDSTLLPKLHKSAQARREDDRGHTTIREIHCES
jgi:hypothetical protein